MVNNIRNILTFIIFISASQLYADTIWVESFIIPDKGIWGDENGFIQSDFSGVDNWWLEYKSLTLSSPNDYAKTVKTSGGRFEVRDVEGEITWLSEWINIKGLSNVSTQLTAYETGSGANISSKYLKAFYRINKDQKIEFEENGANLGNWGKSIAKQSGLSGDSLQIVVIMANYYSSDKVTLDEIIITAEKKDTLPPFVTDVKTKSADSLNIYFNEPVKSPLDNKNFKLISGNEPIQILSVTGANNKFTLIIEPSKLPDIELYIFNVFDLPGNLTLVDTFKFSYFPPIQLYSLIINEIMADPNPPQGLPLFEYIELFNAANFPINLENKQLCINGHLKKLDRHIILPGRYLTLCPTSAQETLGYYGATLAIKGFPSLINSGAAVSIISENNMLIDSIYYTGGWGKNNEKKGGGWSLERIDPYRHCGQAANWLFSENPLGGTPGFLNSIMGNNQDIEPPWLIEIEALNSSVARLQFSETMNLLQILNTNNFIISDGVSTPDSIEIKAGNNIFLHLSNSLSEDKTYSIELLNLSDECGNQLTGGKFDLTWVVAHQGDLAINEVLSNPYEGGADFVELFNNSKKSLYLGHLWISNGKDTMQLISQAGQKIIIPPSGYVACTNDSLKVATPYPFSASRNIVETVKFPAVYNNNGLVILFNVHLEEIDRFYYSKKLHSPVLSDITGVSLERVSANSETNNPANWHSASGIAGYATPGIENSQADKNTSTSVVFSPEAFSPNLDGYNDEYSISYSFKNPGYIGNCNIYDTAGRLMLQLVKNEILATEGTLVWNGEDNTGKKLPLGVYIISFEVFDMEGSRDHYKDAVVLTGRF